MLYGSGLDIRRVLRPDVEAKQTVLVHVVLVPPGHVAIADTACPLVAQSDFWSFTDPTRMLFTTPEALGLFITPLFPGHPLDSSLLSWMVLSPAELPSPDRNTPCHCHR